MNRLTRAEILQEDLKDLKRKTWHCLFWFYVSVSIYLILTGTAVVGCMLDGMYLGAIVISLFSIYSARTLFRPLK